LGWFVVWLDANGDPVGLGPGGVRIEFEPASMPRRYDLDDLAPPVPMVSPQQSFAERILTQHRR